MDGVQVDYQAAQKFIAEILRLSGVDDAEAPVITAVFLWSDLIGRSTQGIGRLPVYLRRLRAGLIKSPCRPELVTKSETMHILNGNDGFGQYLGHVAMSRAITTADQHGLGVVGVNHSNHFGAAAYFVQMAAQDLKLGFAFSNSVPHVAPYGGITATLGTNPLAFGAPTRDGRSVLVDLSTGASAGSTIMKAAADKTAIPEGIVIDEHGDPITDPEKAAHGVVLPFGGAKGYSLGLMVEILAGVITGAAVAHDVASLHRDLSRVSNVGHLFIAIDVASLMDVELYYDRMERLIAFVKTAKKQHGVEEILIPGETRWRLLEQHKRKGIRLDARSVDSLNLLAKQLSVRTPW